MPDGSPPPGLYWPERLAPDYDEDGDGVPDEVDRIALTQLLDDLRAVIAELERELRIDRDDGHGRPRQQHGERAAGQLTSNERE